MFQKISIAVLLIAASVSSTFAQTAAQEQATALEPITAASPQAPTRIISGQASGSSGFFLRSPQSEEARKLQRRISEAAKAFRDADGSEKRDAEARLQEALSEEYDLRLNAYEDHLDDLEKQLEEMRSKLSRKRDAKSDMVRLRIQVLAAEAEDLGWPSANPGSRRSIWSTAPALTAPSTAREQRFPSTFGGGGRN